MSAAAAEIHRLLNENMNLFEMGDQLESPHWKAYVEYIDSLVSDALLRTIGCRLAQVFALHNFQCCLFFYFKHFFLFSLGYLAEHMDPSNNMAPLFEVQLELKEPDLIFVPSLDLEKPDGFIKIVEELISDILSMAKLIPRITTGRRTHNLLLSIREL